MAHDQNVLGICGDAVIGVLVAAISCQKRRSANAFAWDVFGAVLDAVVPLISKNDQSSLVSCFLAPLLQSFFSFLLLFISSLAVDRIIVSPA